MTAEAYTRPAAARLAALSLSRKQIRSVVQCTSSVNLWTGAIRSGKTIASLLAWLMFVANAPLGGELAMVGRTRESLARNVFAPLQDPSLFGEWAKHVVYTPGAPSGTILGRKVWVFGASDSRSEATVRGLTLAGWYGDEVTLWSEALWVTLIGRMSVPGAKGFGTTNPDSPAHWFKRTVIDRAAELGYRVFHYLLTDNKWLVDNNPEYIARVAREYTGLWHRRFILGEWVQAEGAVYSEWDISRHVIKHELLPPMHEVLALGIDFGQTNPTRGVLLGLGVHPIKQRPQLYVLDEWAPPAGGTVAAQSQRLVQWMGSRQPAAWRDPTWVFVDPAAASFKVQLYNDGVANVVNGNNEVLAGIRTVGSLLAADLLQVSDRCTHLIGEIPGYAWDSKATEKGEDKPIKMNDHSADSLRYAIHSSRALWRGAVPVTAAEPAAPGSD